MDLSCHGLIRTIRAVYFYSLAVARSSLEVEI